MTRKYFAFCAKSYNGKSLMGLMTLKIGEKMKLVVNGEDEELSEHFFREYEVDEMYDAVRLEERA